MARGGGVGSGRDGGGGEARGGGRVGETMECERLRESFGNEVLMPFGISYSQSK